MADIEVNVIAEDFYLSPGSYLMQIWVDEYGDYGLSSLGPHRGWVVFERNYFSVSGEIEINFSITPPENTKAGTYRFPIMVYSIEDDSIYSIKEYRLLIEEKTEARIKNLEINKDSFSPGDKIEVEGVVANTGTSDLEELKLTIELEGPGYEKVEEKKFSLYVTEEKEFEHAFETSMYNDPGAYEVSLTLTKFGQKMDSKKKIIEIEEVGKIEKDLETSWRLVQESGTFHLKNVGNVRKTERIEMKLTKPWDWFAFFSEMPEIIDQGTEMAYVWEVTLDRGETKTINYDIHYWPFVIVAIFIIYGLYLVLRQVKKPTIRKHALQTKVLEDDKREVMVALEVKSGGKKMKDVVVEDKIPTVAHLIKDFKTIKPKIRKTNEGIVLRWNLKNLSKRENIILTYRFGTLIGAVGYFRLPRAVLKAKINNVLTEYFSNSLKIKEE
ncbi:MAG: hypothetical protein JSV92_00595 [archaeon]|nr:MAG: hypothetical protein JSV92_00595 [archaeon]